LTAPIVSQQRSAIGRTLWGVVRNSQGYHPATKMASDSKVRIDDI
jgi:hypothetical protein